MKRDGSPDVRATFGPQTLPRSEFMGIVWAGLIRHDADGRLGPDWHRATNASASCSALTTPREDADERVRTRTVFNENAANRSERLRLRPAVSRAAEPMCACSTATSIGTLPASRSSLAIRPLLSGKRRGRTRLASSLIPCFPIPRMRTSGCGPIPRRSILASSLGTCLLLDRGNVQRDPGKVS